MSYYNEDIFNDEYQILNNFNDIEDDLDDDLNDDFDDDEEDDCYGFDCRCDQPPSTIHCYEFNGRMVIEDYAYPESCHPHYLDDDDD